MKYNELLSSMDDDKIIAVNVVYNTFYDLLSDNDYNPT